MALFKIQNQNPVVRLIIPALNEEIAMAAVLEEIPGWVTEIIVVDNGSQDRTAEVCRNLGATVVFEGERGYGAACLKGITSLNPDTDIVVFMDGDYSDFPEEMESLVSPIKSGIADMVLGSRVLGKSEKGALMPVAIFGNWLSTRLIEWGWRFRYTDLGPYRAISYAALKSLSMQDRNFGWTVEMQVKAIQKGLQVMEVPVSYRKRIGQSKISGTIRGSFLAGKKILYIIFREYLHKIF